MKYKLNPSEVQTGGSEGTSCCPGSKKGPRLKRAEVVLVHLPTGVRISGYIPPTIQSKKNWKKIYQEVWDKLFKELEVKVAQHLRIPGQ